MVLQAKKLEAFVATGGDGDVTIGHRYDVTDGTETINVMEWDDVAGADCPDSHIVTNEECGSFDARDVLAAIREAN
jgi:hypothetical protein